MLIDRRKIMSDANRVAHLWPPRFSGRRSWEVKRLINQPWSVSSRLFIHRLEGVGNNAHGKIIASAIRGIPRYTGDIN